MQFYGKNHFQCIFIVKIISKEIFYNKNHFQWIFDVKMISKCIFII